MFFYSVKKLTFWCNICFQNNIVGCKLTTQIDHFTVVSLVSRSLWVNVRLRLNLFWYKPLWIPFLIETVLKKYQLEEQHDWHDKAGRVVSRQGQRQPHFTCNRKIVYCSIVLTELLYGQERNQYDPIFALSCLKCDYFKAHRLEIKTKTYSIQQLSSTGSRTWSSARARRLYYQVLVVLFSVPISVDGNYSVNNYCK